MRAPRQDADAGESGQPQCCHRNRCHGLGNIEPEQEPPGMNAPSTTLPGHAPVQPASNARILMASLVGTSVDFYDFYIYATAASLVFGPLFFPADSHSAHLMAPYARFALPFHARPLGGTVFVHFGHIRIG